MNPRNLASARWLALLLLAGCATLLWLQRYRESRPPESLEALMDAEQISGAVVAVRAATGMVSSRVLNRSRWWPEKRLTASTQLPIASLSKPITASCVRHLAAQGLFDLDTPAITLLPELAKTQDPRYAQITIRHLLQHTSGLDQSLGDPMLHAGTPIGCEGAIAASLKRPLETAPGNRMRYSNTGYCLLGEIVARVTGEDYEEATRQVLGVRAIEKLTLGKPPTRVGLPTDLLRSLGAAGGWSSDAATLAVLYGRDARDPSIPSPTTAPHGDWYYGLGWRVWPQGRTYRLTHFGDLPGTFAAAVAYPDGSSAVVLMDGQARDAETFAAAVYPFLDRELALAGNEHLRPDKPAR